MSSQVALPKNISSTEADKSIDRHLKSGRFAEELNKEKASVENDLTLLRPSADQIDPIVLSKDKEPLPLTVEGENPGERMYKENNPSDLTQRYNALTPEQRVNKKINRDQFAQDYQRSQEEAFLKQYIENARRAGYELKLNSKGEIVDYTEIGTSDPLRFPQSVPQDASSEPSR